VIIDWILTLLPGLGVSLGLTATFLAIGLPLSILFALGQGAPTLIVRTVTQTAVEVAKGMPALVLVYLVYFGMPQLDVDISAFMAAAVALAISFAGYACDSFRAGFDAVPRGQREGAAALGLARHHGFVHVVLPQALKIALPPLIGWTVVYFQATSLAYAISVPELLASAYREATTNFQYFSLIGLAALLYLVICVPMSMISERLVTGRRRPRRRLTPARKATA
jgi:polar amino acid transport system permease protein